MVIGDMGGGASRQSGQDEATIELRLRHMEVQLRQAEDDRIRSEEEREPRTETPGGRIDRLERQAPAQSVSGAQPETTAAISTRAMTPRFDTFSTRTAEPSMGLYKLTRDEQGEVSVELD
ncbi:hypothetical protein [uncultured Intestinimonas sp.]|uniref:hypothetical protein n=1 Tax=uncultured Intestinimonas sp. TaxID=1689265 RepID=UPI0025D5FFD8|nr:hypothetical protein [uncultured Intestinimonas sp.]